MMAACQSSRDEEIRFTRLMPARFSTILTAVSDTSRILPIAILEYLSVRAASISDVGLNGLSSSRVNPPPGSDGVASGGVSAAPSSTPSREATATVPARCQLLTFRFARQRTSRLGGSGTGGWIRTPHDSPRESCSERSTACHVAERPVVERELAGTCQIIQDREEPSTRFKSSAATLWGSWQIPLRFWWILRWALFISRGNPSSRSGVCVGKRRSRWRPPASSSAPV